MSDSHREKENKLASAEHCLKFQTHSWCFITAPLPSLLMDQLTLQYGVCTVLIQFHLLTSYQMS